MNLSSLRSATRPFTESSSQHTLSSNCFTMVQETKRQLLTVPMPKWAGPLLLQIIRQPHLREAWVKGDPLIRLLKQAVATLFQHQRSMLRKDYFRLSRWIRTRSSTSMTRRMMRLMVDTIRPIGPRLRVPLCCYPAQFCILSSQVSKQEIEEMGPRGTRKGPNSCPFSS